MNVETRYWVAVLAALSLGAGCSREAVQPSPAATPMATEWSEPRSRQVAEAQTAAGEPMRLELRHRPAAEGRPARVQLMLLEARGERELWVGEVDPAARERLWKAGWALSVEPQPGGRLAISTDAGARWRPAYPAVDGWLFCPHVQTPGQGGAPDWKALPESSRWAAQVLQTAVWGCGGAGGCQARALAGGPVHQSSGGEELLPKERLPELRSALALAEGMPPDRALALALFDAAVGYQHGLAPEELERLGTLAARALADGGPLGQEERRALRLRLTLAREELKRAPQGQASPRTSIEALSRALEAAQRPALEPAK